MSASPGRPPGGVRSLVCAAAVLVLGGCAAHADRATPGSPLAVGSTAQSISVHGVARTFLAYRPPGLSGAVPLVVMLHGGFGSAAQAERSYRWDAQARVSHFVVAYPDGLHRAWNAGGGCCGNPARTDVDDVGFIVGVVRTIEREIQIDPRRIYVTGISNGGIMAYRLACDTAIFAAIGPDSATELGACHSPVPISVIAIHGTADRNIPYDGGPGDGYGHIDGPAVPALIASWRRIDRCPAPRVSSLGVVTRSVAGCPDGRAVELITITGAGHQWPGSVSRPFLQHLLHLDPPSTALDATAVIWRFFAAHPRNAQPSGQSLGAAAGHIPEIR
jgi:polyhydroxybutyrate depolymerase